MENSKTRHYISPLFILNLSDQLFEFDFDFFKCFTKWYSKLNMFYVYSIMRKIVQDEKNLL